MNKQKLTIIIICTVLAMALVAVSLVMWLVPRDKNQAKLPGETTALTTQKEETETTANTETVVTTDSTETTGSTDATESTETEGDTEPSTKPTEATKPTEPKPTEPKPTEPKPTTPEPTISVEIEEETEPDNYEKDDNFEIDFDDLLGL